MAIESISARDVWIRCTYMPVQERESALYFLLRNWPYMTVEAGKSEICRAGWEARDSGRISVSQLAAEVLLQETLLLKPSADCMRLTHTIKDNLPYFKSTDCRC